jgi:hypothetical protein
MERRVRNLANRPTLSAVQILAWADDHHGRTGRWPVAASGPIPGTDDSWKIVDAALREGLRGLPGGSSLVRLLAKERGVRNHLALPPLTHKKILAWADAHFTRTGRWPFIKAGPIVE